MKGAVLLLTFATALAAQQPLETDARILALAFERARAELILADSARARTRHLFDRSLASRAELEAAEAGREGAVLSVLERWAALTSGAPRLRVMSARKARSSQGAVLVRVVIAATPAWNATRAAAALPPDVMARLAATGPGDAYVSLKDEPGPAGTAIGAPYERRLASASSTVGEQLEFRLLRDVDAVVVSLSSAGRLEERKVWLEADPSGAVAVQAVPFSLEADVGTEASYDLTIERFGRNDAPMRLLVGGLPAEIAAVFSDAGTGTRIGQVRMTPDEHQRRIRLTLTLPPGEVAALTVDSAYRFLVIAAPPSAGQAAGAPAATAEEWRRGGAGVAELELVPRGVGRAELRAFNLYHEGRAAVPLEVAVVLRNAGSRVLDQLRLRSDVPPGWTVTAVPAELRGIPPGAEQPVNLTIVPAAGAELGDYEVRLHIDGSAGRTRLSGEPTMLRIGIRGTRSRAAAAVLVAGVTILAAGAVAATRRLARR